MFMYDDLRLVIIRFVIMCQNVQGYAIRLMVVVGRFGLIMKTLVRIMGRVVMRIWGIMKAEEIRGIIGSVEIDK